MVSDLKAARRFHDAAAGAPGLQAQSEYGAFVRDPGALDPGGDNIEARRRGEAAR